MFSTLDLYNSEGESVSAVFGVIKNIQSLVEKFEPDRVIVCWDTSTSSLWRREIYPGYKMNRKKNNGEEDEEGKAKREDYERQRELLQFALSWLPVYQYVQEEIEADDILYLLSKRVLVNDDNIVVSTDKDLLQLIDSRTSVWSPIKEVLVTETSSKAKELGSKYNIKASTFEQFMGFPLENFVDFKVLQGDKSDGIAGIDGIGEKTAVTLLEKYSSIDGMLQNSEELRKSKRTAKIVDSVQLLEELKAIMDISEVEKRVPNVIDKMHRGIIRPSEEYKKFWNFARDNDFKSIYMNYRIWCKAFENMGIHSIAAEAGKKARKAKRIPRNKS